MNNLSPDIATLPDITKLIVRTAMKDRSAFDSLYRQTSAKLFGVCLRILNNRGDAEEALQEIYVKIWLKADRFVISDLSPISWLVAIARNHAIDCIRARKRPATEIDVALEIADPSPSAETVLIAGGEAARINNCLGELDQDRASAIRGAYLQGESYQDLAGRHNVPLNTMRTWLRRGLLKLKECLER